MAVIDGYPATSFDAKDRAWVKVVAESVLPDTSEANEGDVLTVDSEGKTAWEAPSGGGGSASLFVEVVYNEVSGEYEANKTFTEITNAINNGTMVYVLSDGLIIPLRTIGENEFTFWAFVSPAFDDANDTMEIGFTAYYISQENDETIVTSDGSPYLFGNVSSML